MARACLKLKGKRGETNFFAKKPKPIATPIRAMTLTNRTAIKMLPCFNEAVRKMAKSHHARTIDP